MARGQPQGEESYQQQVPVEDLPRKIIPEIRDAGQVGAAISRVGESMDAKYRADSATYASNALSDFRVSQTQTTEDMKEKADPDPVNFSKDWSDQYDKQAKQLTQANQRNPYAAAMIDKGLREFKASLGTHVQGWEAAQRVDYRANSFDSALEAQLPVATAHPETATQIGSTLHDQLVATGLKGNALYARMRHMDDQLSMAAGNGLVQQNPRGVLEGLKDPTKADPVFSRMTDAQLESFRNKANEQLTKPIFSALEQDKTGQAAAYLKANQDVMDPQTAWRMSRMIDAQVKEKQNEQKQDIADRYQDSLTAAKFGLPNAIQVTPAELGILFPKDAKRHVDGLNMVAAAGAAAKEYDKMSPEDIRADLERAKPTTGGPEATFAIEGYEARARAAHQSITERSSDPAGFAIKNGSWQPLDLSDPKKAMDELTTRANTQGQVSQQTGVNTPLLSKAEQKQMTSWLASQPPAQRLDTLSSLRTNLPGDMAFTSLVKQIAPGSPLTAIAASTLDKPTGQAPVWYDPSHAVSPQVGQNILEGESILTPKKDEKGGMKMPSFPMPSPKDLQPSFQAAMGGADSNLFRGRPDTQSAYYAAYKASYAAEASRAGVTSGIINPEIAQKAAQDVLGHVTQYGHTAVSVPNGMAPDRFEGAVNAASRTALTAAGYSAKDIATLHGYGLRELGDTLGTGRYVVINGNGDPLKSKDGGQTVVIDINQQYADVHAPEEAKSTRVIGGMHGH